MTTPPGSGDQPQTPGQGWGQQPPSGQQPAGQPSGDPSQQGQWAAPGSQPQQPGQPQQFGQPGQQQFGQPGQPGQQPWGAPGQPTQPPKKSAVARILPIVAGVVVVIVVGILVRSFLGGPSAAVGDCLNDSLTEIGKVDCDSGEAAYRVVSVVEDTTQADLVSGSECTDFPNATSYAFEGDTSGGEGTGYCLESVG
ncbi:hypothetical protein SAMN05660199_03274 [Klenkia soli]|uniref:Uncharacterized protein n=1 Tax=Klenkia soli TaxID=1052260 RepID=A0A1H0QCU6_9ACTN|nr:hypothetical protein [Klenkia soli]SDP14516.1 hypothetical protein SAMN05660199_03274 [Klenkia soli]